MSAQTIMTRLLRRLRGLTGLGLFTGAMWAVIGAILGTAALVLDPASVDTGEGPLWIAYYFGRGGFVAGVVAGIVLALIERGRSLGALRLSHAAVWGALGGLSLPLLAVGPLPMVPLFALLGAGTSCGALVLARRADRRSVASPPTSTEIGAGAG